jgi:hypothetical protein
VARISSVHEPERSPRSCNCHGLSKFSLILAAVFHSDETGSVIPLATASRGESLCYQDCQAVFDGVSRGR